MTDLAAAVESWQPFYAAYEVGNEYQSSVMVFSYVNPRRLRVYGLGFLIDHNPPWEGAVKDTLRLGQRSPEDAVETYTSLWEARGDPPAQIDAAEAKRRMLDALTQNREQGIRLPSDLITERALFQSSILTLPDTPQTPVFTIDDFDALASEGRRPEMLMRTEQTMGYQTRTADGKIVRILRLTDDD